MSTHYRLVAWIVVLTALAGDIAAGQESDTLPPVPTGYLLVTQRGCGIEAIKLPTVQRKIVRPATPENRHDWPSEHAMSGPDSAGRIAYIEDHFFVAHEADRRHLLKTIRLDGTQDTTLFSRPGAAMWSGPPIGNGQIGEHLALSPVGGRVAFHTDLHYVHMPNAALHVGSIEIWNIDSKLSVKRDVNAMDSPLAWFPDGKRLAYVKVVDPREARTPGRRLCQGVPELEKIPSVFVWDVDAGTETFLHVGSAPMVSQDGRFVLISGYESAWVRVRVTSRPVNPQVAYHASKNAGGSVIASPAQDIVLASEKTHKRKRGLLSLFEVPEQIVTFGLASLNTDDFRTLLTVEYANGVSFGQVSEKRER